MIAEIEVSNDHDKIMHDNLKTNSCMERKEIISAGCDGADADDAEDKRKAVWVRARLFYLTERHGYHGSHVLFV